MKNSYRFFSNRECQYFPCHENIKNDEFNCLFCYCPLYLLGEDCGGNFTMKNGIKNCTSCMIPHVEQGYDYINKKLKDTVFQKGNRDDIK